MISEEIECILKLNLARKIKKLKTTGKEEWIIEIGESNISNKSEETLLKENPNNPIFIRKDTKTDFHFRIRNMIYNKENYLVEVDKDKEHIVIKTQNKKYYKKFDIPDLKRLKLQIEPSNLKVNFSNNTLIINVILI
jgi:hypothetical protein